MTAQSDRTRLKPAVGVAAACVMAALGAWVGAAPRGLSYGLAVVACALAALGVVKGGRLAAAGGFPPALYLTWRLLTYWAEPSRWSPYAPPALVALTAVAWVLASRPFVKRTRILTGAGVLVVSTCAAFMAAEFVVNKFKPRDLYALAPESRTASTELYQDDADLIRVHTPGFVGRFQHPEFGNELFEVNADGFRDAPWPNAPDPSESRILFLGDSTLVGLGVDGRSTIPALVEAHLMAAAPGRRWRALNAGVSSYGPPQELRVYKRFAARVKPMTVVVVFYDGNDVEDSYTHHLHLRQLGGVQGLLSAERQFFEYRLGELPRIAPESIPPAWSRRFWVDGSALYRLADARFGHSLVKLGLLSPLAVYNEGMLRAMAVRPDALTQGAFELAIQALTELLEECRTNGARMLFVRLPAKIQTEPAHLEALLTELGLDRAAFRRELPGERALAAIRERGGDTLDLLPVLEDRLARSNPNYFEEGHPNRMGIVKIARAIGEVLTALPSAPK